MKKNIKIIKTVFNIWLIFILIITSFVTITSARDPIYNAKVNIRIQWGNGAFKEPIVPRDEIAALNISVIIEIKTGESFGAGLLEGYNGTEVLIYLYIVEYPSWCYATLKSDLLITSVAELAVAESQVLLIINENAPAYANGYIKLRIKVDNLGLIKGDDQIFTLPFRPAFFPLIKTEFTGINTMQIDPYLKAVFPIIVENAGNAKTKVFFKVENVPEGWAAAIIDSIILDETPGSTKTVYLTVIPSNNFGYHYEQAVINVKITPAFAEDIDQVGSSIYGNFIVRNRGFSSGGLEFYLPVTIIILVIIYLSVKTFKKKRKKEKTV